MTIYMKKLFAQLRDIETGGEGSSAGGGESISESTGQESATEAGQGIAADQSTDTGPASMLEAIEQGLSKTEPTEEAKAAERARDEQGRFAKAQEEKAAEAEKAAAKPQKPGDELAMPEGLSARAQERFQALTSRLHESTARAQAAESDLNSFREVLKQTGGRPEDFAKAFDYIGAVNRGDLQSALNLLDAQRRQISLAMGKPLPGADPLAEFPDLKQRVESYQMDEQAAIEIARARQQQAAMAQRQQAEQGQQQQNQRQLAERSTAMQDVDRMGKEWAARDPDYAMKEDIILKQIPTIAQNFPPSMWAAQVRILYQTISAMPMQQQRAATPPPLRSSGQGGGSRVPTSMLDALNSGLGYGN
jgi:hypothetical protein